LSYDATQIVIIIIIIVIINCYRVFSSHFSGETVKRHSLLEMLNEIWENRISVLETKSGSTPLTNEIRIYPFFIVVKEIT